MVVANPVLGDSRVQKAAYSAAAAGWATTLVGISPDANTRHYRLGAADVVLVPVAAPQPGRRLARAALVRLQKLARSPGSGNLAGRLIWLVTARTSVRAGLPRARDIAAALTPAIVALEPDLVHAHDHTALPATVAAHAVLSGRGRAPAVVYDAHEFVPGLLAPSPVWAAAADRAERAGIAVADAVVTVSHLLADRLVQRHSLAIRPTVVANAPLTAAAGAERHGPASREVAGVTAGTPWIVYAGVVAPQRGVDTVVAALAQIEQAHLGLVSPPSWHLDALLARAARAGVADRVHVLPYVPSGEVPAYLADADVGVVPLLHSANHEVAMSTKWYDYVLARLPIITSDVESMATECRRLGNGEVFVAGDPSSCATAIRTVLADADRYRRAYTDDVLTASTWQHQVKGLLALYEKLLGGSPTPLSDALPFALEPSG